MIGLPSQLPLEGEPHTLCLVQDESATHGCRLRAPGFLDIIVAANDLPSAVLGAEARTTLKLWLKKRARDVLPQRVRVWQEKMGLVPRRVLVNAPTRQWGSCSVDNDIRLNWRLILLPPDIMDYVVAHELAHIRHKHHQRPFWAFLKEVMPDVELRRRTLRRWEREGAVLSLLREDEGLRAA